MVQSLQTSKIVAQSHRHHHHFAGPAVCATCWSTSQVYLSADELEMGGAGAPLRCPLPFQQVQRPRLLICGEEGSGQSHLGPALLYALEGLPVHALGLPSLLSDASARSVFFLITLLYHNLTLTDKFSVTQAEIADPKSACGAVLIVACEAQQAPAKHHFVLSVGLQLWQSSGPALRAAPL